ncbi:MAG: hypothetical protein CMD99_00950 [Gammaproteobacteria bacterium]|nr:hypothetical protein [Gammaproteobacteria bacterium]
MSFFTSLTGLNAATTQLSVTSNNIANAGTTGFKRSRSDFGDIFATSPLQKASTVVGQGTALKQVTQEFSQGNIELSGNSLDLAVTGEGFFPLRSADGQDLFTRNGSFLLDEQNTVVNSAGQFLKVASVDSLGKADFKAELIPLLIAPKTTGEAVATDNIDFAINFPAESLPLTTIDENNLEQIKPFNPEDSSTYAKSAAITIFDENGNDFLLTFFYRRVGVASANEPFNKWQTHVVLDGQEITPALGQATAQSGTPLFVDKYGNIVPENELPVVLNDNLVFQKYNLDDLSSPNVSEPAKAKGGLVELPYLSDEAGQNFAPIVASQTLTVNRDELENVGTNASIQMTLTADLGGGLSEATTLKTTTAARGYVGFVNSGDVESGDVVSIKLQEDGTSGADAAIFTTAALPADASAAQIVTSLNSANAVIGVSSVEDLISTDLLEFTVTSAEGQEYTFNNVATYAADGTTPATLTSLGDAATLADVVAGLNGPAVSPFTLSATSSGIVVSQDRPSRTLSVTGMNDLSYTTGGETPSVIGLEFTTEAGDIFTHSVNADDLEALEASPVSWTGGTDVAPLTDRITLAGHGYSTGDQVTYSATAADTGLAAGTYYVIAVDANTIQLAASSTDATAGAAVALTGDGVGEKIVGVASDDVDLATLVSYLNANPATDSSLVFATNTAGTKLIITNGVSGDNRFDETNSFKVGFMTSHSVDETSTFAMTWNSAGASLSDGDSDYSTSQQFTLKLGARNSIASGDVALTENISSVSGTALSATATGLTNTEYSFELEQDTSGNTLNTNLIKAIRADGTNFKVALGGDHALSGDAALHEHISTNSNQLTTSYSASTTNGSVLASTPTTAEIVEALNGSAAGTGYRISASTTDAFQFVVSRIDGTDFTVTVDEEPTGLSTGQNLLSGVVSDVVTALASGDVTQISTNGVEAFDLSQAFELTIDEDPNDANATDAIMVDLSAMTRPENSALSGEEVAALMTQEINRQFGDQRFFNVSSDANRQFRILFDADGDDVTGTEETSTPLQVVDVFIPASTQYTEESLAAEITSQIREATNTHISVEYSRASKGFVFSPEDDSSKLRITNVPAEASLTGSLVPNTLFGLTTQSSDFTIDSRGRYPAEVVPNGSEQLSRDSGQQRYGVLVEFLPNTEEGGVGGTFTIASGETGDTSAMRITNVSADAKTLFGFDSDNPSAVLEVVAEEGSTAVRGVVSTAAKVFGKPVSIDPDETFFTDDLSNQFTVTVDNVTETFRLPVGNYNLNSFKTALQNRINAMQDNRGNSISGVVVDFDQTNEIFTFTSGTSGDSSFFQVSGSSRYGLEGIDSSVGQTSTYRPPVSEQTSNGRPIYVTKDENGVFREYSTDITSGFSELPGSREFTNDPEFRPLFLDKGELTFDTAGNLISPLGGISLDNVVIGGSGNTLNIDIDYAGSTQFSGDFSVNSQSQNGQPNGSLVAVDIADDGLVTASYSNGTQGLKGKIVLSTFSTPNGLRQLGDSTFLESNESGRPTLGEPGGAGFGTIRAGARERANVDLTSELVDLITAQRNFQANAKAIETSSTLTSTIINIRS